ncbi:helix-turn-helix domain-containing protein [Fusicatenibacter saccharivorans]|uniref:helix-turn-helix domain-containing protein n=1 Tax=Fusicatenibacter saccharivorans TaxID=1150298 RepID=UPI003D03185E
MRKNLQTAFSTRQYMVAQDFEIYYYNDQNLEKVALHSHDYYEFYFFLEGDVSIQIGQETFPIKYGDIMLMPPHIPHKPIIHSHEVPYRRFVFWISQEYCSHLLQLSPDYVYLMQYVETSKTYLFHNDRITFNTIQSLILRLIEEMHSERFGRAAQITLCVNDLVLFLNRLIYARNVPSSPGEERDLYRQLTAYIEEHLDEDLPLEKLAEEFYVSKYHIAHVFKDRIGISIHQYITKKRLALCKEAILGNANISEIYQTYGFGDYSSFFRAFKKEYGISPKDYRDKHLAKYD